MDAQDKITEKLKEAARKIESTPGFPSMEGVWGKIEERLEEEQKWKKVIPFWKKGMAAAILLLISLSAFYWLRREDHKQDATKTIVQTKQLKLPPEKREQPIEKAIAQTPVSKEKIVQAKKVSQKPTAIEVPSPDTEPSAITFGNDPNKMASATDDSLRIVKGIVLDDMMQPMPGASVVVKGTTRGTTTDMDGKYAIEMKSGEQALVIKSIGVKDQEVSMATGNSLLITKMVEDKLSLQEVQVYGKAIDKRSYTGALRTVTAKDIARRPVTDIGKVIEGAAPGVQVSSGGGQPGATPDILMRGVGSIAPKNAPLIVLDGVPYNGSLVSINPNEVEKMTVLKDASATGLYGSRGVNGVIVITTKTGAEKHSGSFFNKTWKKVKRLFQKSKSRETSMIVPQAEAPERIAPDQESYDSFIENPFENPLAQPLSTFSIDVDNASYTNIRRFINNGEIVPRDAVRIEEMINYFSYKYPQPTDQHPFSINTEYSDAPWNTKHKLLKIGLQGRIIPDEKLPASNLVFLVDVSGSMNEENKLPLLVSSMKLLVKKLREQDKVAIVVYAGAAGLVLPATAGSQKKKIIDALDQLQAGGSTAGGAGIKLAYQVARANFIKGGNNRVILATDGDFNVGASSDADMETLIEQERKSNIFLTCLGYGMGNYKDSKMEILADKGNGNYAYIDNIGEANRFLVKEFGGTMYSIAKDVKIQIEFNPAYVQSYRLIGYENRKLRNEDFVNDAIDAGELGSGHTVTALYEIIPAGAESEYAAAAPSGLRYTAPATTAREDFKNELATVKFRYKKPDGDKSIEMVQQISHKPVALSASSPDFKLAASVAWFGLKLRVSKLIPDTATNHILQLAKQGIAGDKDDYKSEFVGLVETVQ